MDNISELFDKNISSIDSSVKIETKDDFVNDIVPKIQSILNRVFSDNPSKRKIRIYKDRISFAAPCCGDSAKNNYKKRGNIILDGKFRNMYKCFNCGCCMSLNNFFKQYGEKLSLGEINYIEDTKVDFKTSANVDTSSISYLCDLEKVESLCVDRNLFKTHLRLRECTEYHFGRDYLIKRKQFDNSKFLYSDFANKLFVLNLTPSGKIFGLQVRSFSGGAKYKTYSLQKIHDVILKDGVNIPDEINTLSMIFNILLIDINSTVTVLEGPMDSFLMKNSIALCGAGKNIVFPFKHRFLFDDDKAGREHAIEKLKEGHYVFLWDSVKHDMGLITNGKMDINDLVLWCDKNNIKFPNLNQYFTNDMLDLTLI